MSSKSEPQTPGRENYFDVPWGSENICMWCKKEGKCILHKRSDATENEMRLIDLFWKSVISSQIVSCPLQEFEPNNESHPNILHGRKIRARSYHLWI